MLLLLGTPGLAEANARDLLSTIPVVVAVAVGIGEVWWRGAQPGADRRALVISAGSAGTMGLGGLVVAIGYLGALRGLWGLWAHLSWAPLENLWVARPALGFVAAFVIWDLAGWAYHLVGHRTRVGWAAHQVHHSGGGYDLTIGWRQTWLPLHGLVIYPIVAVAGFDFTVVVGCAALSNCWQLLLHTAAPIRLPRGVTALVMTPESHRHHHGRGAPMVNLGPVFTIWDRLAGTWVPLGHPPPTEYGPVEPTTTNPITIQLAGWRALTRTRPDGSAGQRSRMWNGVPASDHHRAASDRTALSVRASWGVAAANADQPSNRTA